MRRLLAIILLVGFAATAGAQAPPPTPDPVTLQAVIQQKEAEIIELQKQLAGLLKRNSDLKVEIGQLNGILGPLLEKEYTAIIGKREAAWKAIQDKR